MKQLTGAEIVIECLKEQGVDTVFGYPGGAILNIYDALYKQSDIRHILTSHEQGASHAADGYARATGKVGVCMATSGPGATNLVTGIATAYMDSIPMVAITANVAVSILGKDSFQEVDISGVVMPISKHSYIVKDIRDLADTIRKAFMIARTGRPGPVLVDITKDVTAAIGEYEPKSVENSIAYTKEVTDQVIENAIAMIQQSKKPYLMIGGGTILSNASKEVAEFIEKVDLPVCDTLMGKGAFDGASPRYTGMIGMHGTKATNFGVTECDLLIVLGARFSDRVCADANRFAAKAKILQIDIDEAEVNKNKIVDESIIGDIKYILQKINQKLEPMKHTQWMEYIKNLKTKYPLTYKRTKLSGPAIVETISEITDGNAILSTDVGQHQMWTAQFYQFRSPRTFLTSGGLGTMGYGLGAAMGAKMGCPNKTVINIAGDGCFRMNLNELATLSRYEIPVIEIVFNNQVLGMVRQWQSLFYEERYSYTNLKDKVDFVKVAEGLGVKAVRVETLEEFKKAFQEAIAQKIPVVIECMLNQDDKVWPMCAPGTSIQDAFSEEDLVSKLE
ncbi:MAG: biosynthetic-type acetolactate synthase large subunit [Firmicutes bacterium]|uniref:Acetolactate synthase n=1 Tax=Candidatus Scybalomonas excrementavium TaxID=2840943 RepID=A0A9D9N7D2_9FIRM|nr:biosynthetic-type acetolactate synthase large subunit [Candidatus Scybalomonas excrementavium]